MWYLAYEGDNFYQGIKFRIRKNPDTKEGAFNPLIQIGNWSGDQGCWPGEWSSRLNVGVPFVSATKTFRAAGKFEIDGEIKWRYGKAVVTLSNFKLSDFGYDVDDLSGEIEQWTAGLVADEISKGIGDDMLNDIANEIGNFLTPFIKQIIDEDNHEYWKPILLK